MSVSIQITCDACGTTNAYNEGRGTSPTSIRKLQVERVGWTGGKGHKDYCPMCSTAGKK